MNLKKKIKYKIIVLILSLALVAALAVTSFVPRQEEGAMGQTGAENAQAGGASEEERAEPDTGSQLSQDKSETVYAKADASGKVRDITVGVVLKGERSGSEIRDVSNLEDIKNTKNDDEYQRKEGDVLNLGKSGRRYSL